jgi:Flavin containing amine oxidoreductase
VAYIRRPIARDRSSRRRSGSSAPSACLGRRCARWHERRVFSCTRKSWHLDDDVGGGYLALLRSGTSEGRLHWACSEIASEHPGYLDGAIEAGLRAASEVVQVL